MRIGVLVPCRNEAAVIERKLANLARLEWPGPRAEQRVVIVDDGSEDDTAVRARAAVGRGLAGLRVVVVSNRERAGKPGALRTGLAELGESCDLVVLTDADVLLEPRALCRLAEAFQADRTLAMACGAQRFVRELPPDGSFPHAAASACGAWDRWTARVRALESRAGALFSVHGQLLAWRAELALVPRLGIAADDLDLMLQVRARGQEPRRVRLVGEAHFAEQKTPAGPRGDEQALRRARAYLQVLRASRSPGGGLAERLQWLFYRWVPLHAPAVTWCAIGCVSVAGPLALDGAWRALPPLAVGLALVSPPGRRWLRLMGVIARAIELERGSSLPERWEMARS